MSFGDSFPGRWHWRKHSIVAQLTSRLCRLFVLFVEPEQWVVDGDWAFFGTQFDAINVCTPTHTQTQKDDTCSCSWCTISRWSQQMAIYSDTSRVSVFPSMRLLTTVYPKVCRKRFGTDIVWFFFPCVCLSLSLNETSQCIRCLYRCFWPLQNTHMLHIKSQAVYIAYDTGQRVWNANKCCVYCLKTLHAVCNIYI